MNKFLGVLLLSCFLFYAAGCSGKSSLQKEMERIIQTKQARVGAAVFGGFSGKELIAVNGDLAYPMQSTYKFHLALAILDLVDKGTLRLDQEIFIPQQALPEGTHSPLRDTYPDGNIFMTVEELLEYAVSKSDNAACDILFDLAGGTEAVNNYIGSLGITDINIGATEEEMHANWDAQYSNTSTPKAAAALLQKFYTGNILSYDSRDLLFNLMRDSATGENRIKALLPAGTTTAHKTGTGPEKDGVIYACNDIGVITFTDGGKYFVIAVFITDSKEPMETNERIIADIAKAACDYFIKGKK